MGYVIHKTVEVQVWVPVDEGIADIVRYLNTIPGVHTTSSCQGTIGEGGPHPYPPNVCVTWDTDQTLERLKQEFDLNPDPEQGGDHWGMLLPKGALAAHPLPW
jgi:hypothetical protein